MTTETFEELLIEFSNPKSFGNRLKQFVMVVIGVVLAGLGLLGVLGIFRDAGILNGTVVAGIFFLLAIGVSLIKAGLSRHEAYKRCFIHFTETQLKGCMAITKPQSDDDVPNLTSMATRSLEAPKYAEFELKWAEIERVENELKNLTLVLHDKKPITFSLDALAYIERKKIIEKLGQQINKHVP